MDNKDIFDNEWEQELLPENEMKEIQKSIRKRNWKIITISVILAAVVLLGCVQFLIPAVENLYWSPTDGSIGEGVSDLNLVLSAYTELFCPGWEVSGVNTSRNGFASYDLNIIRRDIVRDEYSYMTGSLVKNTLGWDFRFSSEQADHRLFGTSSYTPFLSEEEQSTAEKLAVLPEYVTVEASVVFSEDLDMEQILALREKYDLPIAWIAIRHAPEEGPTGLLCGMSPFSGSTIYYEVNEKYPQFGLETHFTPEYKFTADNLEQHFTSLLQLSCDMVEAERGVYVFAGERNYYSDALEYVEDHGINSYACLVFTSPQKLLALLEEDCVDRIHLSDAWIDLD